VADTVSFSNRWGASAIESGGYHYAGFWRRLAALLIDMVILVLIAGTVAAYLGLGEGWRMLLAILRRQEVISDDGIVVTSLVPMPVVTCILVIFILIPWLYFALLESSRNQATLGKMACRVQVSDLHGKQITFARATLRHFSKFLSVFLLYTGFFCIAYTRYSQGLHDIIAASLVLYKRETIE
jgi:uncharacterized RDD family membrane protein YckC